MNRSYKNAGVDISASEAWVSRILTSTDSASPQELKKKLITGVGDYAAVYALSSQQWVAASCDGVGSKALWHRDLGSSQALAQDLLAMNANDLLCVGAKPTLFLDYLAIGKKELLEPRAFLGNFIEHLAQQCALTNQLLIGGETAQMPDLYSEDNFDLAGFSIGFLGPDDFLSVEKIYPGSEVWGWPSSGPHSNGFTWLRKIFDENKDREFIQKHLLSPTRLYVNEFFQLKSGLQEKGLSQCLQGAFHITGSGLLNFLRAQPKKRKIGFDLTGWPSEPFWATELQKRSSSKPEDLYTAMNMGIGFAVVLSATARENAEALLDSLKLRYLGEVTDEAIVRVAGLEFS